MWPNRNPRDKLPSSTAHRICDLQVVDLSMWRFFSKRENTRNKSLKRPCYTKLMVTQTLKKAIFLTGVCCGAVGWPVIPTSTQPCSHVPNGHSHNCCNTQSLDSQVGLRYLTLLPAHITGEMIPMVYKHFRIPPTRHPHQKLRIFCLTIKGGYEWMNIPEGIPLYPKDSLDVWM